MIDPTSNPVGVTQTASGGDATGIRPVIAAVVFPALLLVFGWTLLSARRSADSNLKPTNMEARAR